MSRIIKTSTTMIMIIILIFVQDFTLGLHVSPDEETFTQNPVLFVHGLSGRASNWDEMIDRFVADGRNQSTLYSYDFNLRHNCTATEIKKNADQISLWVDGILNDTGAKKIDLVAASMGTVSSRYFIKFLDTTDRIDDYVSIVGGHHGFEGIPYSCTRLTDLLITLNEGDETPRGILDDTIGDRQDNQLAVTYNGTHVPGNISYTAIYSRNDTAIIPYNSSRLEGATNIVLDDLDHTEVIRSEIGYQKVKEAIEDFPPIISTTDTTTSSSSETNTQTPTSSSSSDISEDESANIPFFAGLFGMFVFAIIMNKKSRLVQ